MPVTNCADATKSTSCFLVSSGYDAGNNTETLEERRQH